MLIQIDKKLVGKDLKFVGNVDDTMHVMYNDSCVMFFIYVFVTEGAMNLEKYCAEIIINILNGKRNYEQKRI